MANENRPIIQVVVLAGGSSSRFYPFNSGHKSTYEICGRPIVQITLESLIQTGLEKIILVGSPQDNKLQNMCVNFPSVVFVPQSEPLGQAHAILQAQPHLDKSAPVLVINAQHINIKDHLQAILNYDKLFDDHRAVYLLSQKTSTPHKYGMLKLVGEKVEAIIEKPQATTEVSDERVVGIYLFSPDFLEYLSQTPVTQYQLERDLNVYAKKYSIIAIPTPHETISLKYPWDIFHLGKYLLSQLPPWISPNTKIHETAIIEGPVVIEEGAKIFEFAIIKGPCYIGKNTVVGSFTTIRDHSILENGVECQRYLDIKNSHVGPGTHIHSGYIGDSIIGRDVRIGANFITANKRLDRGHIKVKIKGELVDTSLTSLGCMIGSGASIGIHVGTNPGKIIAPQNRIIPGSIV